MLTLAILLCFSAAARAITCAPGTFYWVRGGIERCQLCQPGCACPGNYSECFGCSDGAYSADPGAAACSACPPGTTSDGIYNAGCDPENFLTPCANNKGQLGQVRCRPVPPPENASFVAPSGALFAPPQYLTDEAPYVPNKVPPYYDVDKQPMLQPSY